MVVDSAYNHSKFSNMEETKPKRISTEDIEKFIDGHDPQRKIVNLLYRYRDDFITVVYRDENDIKRQRKENFYPFCWAKLSACRKLCGGDRQELIKLMNRFKIGVKKLSQTNVNGEVRHEFDDGYLFLFYAKSPMSYSDFLYFFKKAGNPIYSDKKKEEEDPLAKRNSGNKQYLCVTPQEQFMISTGKRFFKGYDDYDEVLKMTFDLETTGLDTDKDEIEQIGIRINRPFPGHPNGFERIFTNLGRTKEERGEWELWMIEQMLKIIYTFKPDVITAHNGENFDWNMIIGACNRLGVSFEELSAKYFNGEGIKKSNKPSSLKLGGEREDYYETIVPGIIITDSLHAVRRAQALDSNMLKADLKYVTEYSKMKKPNRVYIPGKEISNTWADKDYQYALNDENGDWYRYDPEMEDDETKFEPIYGKKDFIPVHGFVKDGYELKSGRYIAERYLFDDLWECDKVEHRYNTPNFLICKMLPVPYKKCTTMGTAGQWKALMLAWSYEQGIAVPSFGDKAKFTGGLSRLLRTGYVKNVIKLDYNSLYPSIILTWGISDPTDLMQAMLNFLEHVLTQREKYKGLKKIAGKKKNSATTDEEKRKYAAEESANDKKQLPLKILGNSFFGSYGAPDVFPWGSLKCAEQTTCTGRQALRLMISHFKKIGYEPIVGDTDGFNFALPDESTYRYTKEHPYISPGLSRETEAGKEYVGFKGDVAEFNDVYMCDKHYSPNGINKMGLGIDEVVSSTINFSRKNYADYFPENPYPEDVKLVGNTIKSKKMPEYIAKFLAKGVRLLLRGMGQEFLDEYYSYIDKIYNLQIPLRDIATKGKIKKSIDEYLRDVKQLTSAGREKSRQAWYELAIKHNLNVANGDTIYYVNTGKSKSHADIKKVTKYMGYDMFNEKRDITKELEKEYKAWKKEAKAKQNYAAANTTMPEYIQKFHPDAKKEFEIVMNCALLPREIIDKEGDTFCDDVSEELEYNVPKYIDMFNKRIKPLLVCFKSEIRSQIMIDNPENRPYFTEEQCELTSGEPFKEGDQDTYERLMTMEDKEIKFWTSNNMKPPFFEECGMGVWEEVVEDYYKRMEEEERNGIKAEKDLYQSYINSLTEDEINDFIEEGILPSRFLNIIDIDVNSTDFISKKYNVPIGSIDDFLDAEAEVDSDE